MLVPLLAKDFRRAYRNPIPYAIHLALPLLVTALIGLTFGRSSQPGGLGRIQLAIVDEDNSPLTDFVKAALTQREAGEYLDIQLMSREEAITQITDNQISAVWIIPLGFTQEYFDGEKTVAFELIKNPAQTYYPAIVEEVLDLLTTGLNAIGRGLRSELPAWREAFEQDEPDLRAWARLLDNLGDRLEAVRPYLYPALVQYSKEKEPESASTGADAQEEPEQGFSLFAYLLAGMSAMFLLFIADNAIRDLYREVRFHTLERFHTLREGLFVFVMSKAVFALAILLLAALLMLGGGALVFRFAWRYPLEMFLLTSAYACFGTGLMAFVAALAANERRADLFNTLLSMGLGLAGGCMFPPHQLPSFLRDSITPWLPTYWFAEATRAMQFEWDGPGWAWAAAKLAVVGIAGLAGAAFLFRVRLERGLKA